MKNILVRADDLGYSRAVNYGIFDSINNGFINNVGVMVNMPATKQGLNLLKNEDIDIGQHTNFSNGKPILPADQVRSLVDDDGFFKSSKVYRKNYKDGKPDFVDLDEAVSEVDAQYHKFLELVGRKPDYFEGHAVISNNFVKALQIVADKYDLPLLRFSFDDKPIHFKNNTKFKMYMDSMKPNYDPKKTLDEMMKQASDSVVPLMVCHPGYLDQDILNHSSLTIPRTQEVEMAMSKDVLKKIKENNIHLLKYSECN